VLLQRTVLLQIETRSESRDNHGANPKTFLQWESSASPALDNPEAMSALVPPFLDVRHPRPVQNPSPT